MLRNKLRITLVGATTLVIVAPLAAQPSSMTFRSVEFMPSDQRMSAARHVLAAAAPEGTLLGIAEQRLYKAGACCKPEKGSDQIRCEYVYLEHPTGHPIRDIAWTVHLTPDANGHVIGSSISRDVYGL